MPTATQSCAVDGLTVRFERRGQGPALVLVHGLLGYSFSWRRVMEPFSKVREVFAIDLPGAGFSDCNPFLDGRLSAAAHRLLRCMDVLQIRSCDLIGSSYGGTTALMLAAIHPERIRTSTLVSPANPWSRTGRKRLALLNMPGVGRFFPPVARRIRPLHGLFVRRMYGDQKRVTRETLDGYSLPLVRKGVFEHAVKIARSWHADMDELKVALPSASDIPTLLVWGSKDRLVEQASAEILSRNFKRSRIVVLPGAGHLPYEECPQEFVRVVCAFLDQPAGVLDGK